MPPDIDPELMPPDIEPLMLPDIEPELMLPDVLPELVEPEAPVPVEAGVPEPFGELSIEPDVPPRGAGAELVPVPDVAFVPGGEVVPGVDVPGVDVPGVEAS